MKIENGSGIPSCWIGGDAVLGNIDAKAKEYMQRPEVFADLFNHLMYNGEQMVKPEKLSTMDPTEITLIDDEFGKVEAFQKYRDVLKKAVMMEDADAAYLMILGIENQAKIHYAMPVRNMIYDALNYGRQVEAIGRQREDEKIRGTSHEYLSRFGRENRIIPVVTLVVYFGQDEWDGPLSIHEMFPKCSSGLLKYVPEYRINLISPISMSEEEIEKFKSDFKQLAKMIRWGKDKAKWEANIEKDDSFKHVDKLTAELACSVTNTKFRLKVNEKGEVDVCQAVKEIREEERQEGRAEGEDRAMALMQKLFAAGRIDDAKKASEDPEYKKQLLKEFALA